MFVFFRSNSWQQFSTLLYDIQGYFTYSVELQQWLLSVCDFSNDESNAIQHFLSDLSETGTTLIAITIALIAITATGKYVGSNI